MIKECYMKTIWLALLLSLVGLVTMACARFEIGVVVNEDGSGVINYQVALKDELMAMAGMAGEGEDFNFMDELGDLPAGAEVQDYEEDGYTGVTVTVPISDFTDAEAVGEVLNGLSGSTESDLQSFNFPSISKDEDGAWQFSMLIPNSEDSGVLMGNGGPGDGMDEVATMLLADASFRVRVKLPGEVVEHNADRIEDGELVWELDILSTESRQLTARSVPGNRLPIVPIVAGVAGVVVLVALVLLAYVRRRR